MSYPEDATDKRLAGKTFVYTVKVNGIKQKSLPELNDDFAKELGEFAGLDRFASRFATTWKPRSGTRPSMQRKISWWLTW